MSRFDRHLLVPAVHAADRVGMDGEGQVLMHTALAPENAGRVWIIALKRLDAFQLTHAPGTIGCATQRDQRGGPAVRACARFEPPASEVVRTGDHARPYAIGHPGTIDVVAD